MSNENQLPAELRVAPTTEPTLEVDAQAHVPPEAAVVALTDGDGAAALPDRSGASQDAVAAAEAAGEQADAVPAELRVPPTAEPTVEVGEGSHIPPEAGVTQVVHRSDHGPAS